MAKLSCAQRTVRRYGKYAAIDRELRAQTAHDEAVMGGADYVVYDHMNRGGYDDVVDEATYSDMGRKTVAAISNLLDALAGARAGAARPQNGEPVAMKALDDAISDLNKRISGVENSMQELSGFISRTDRMLLAMYRRMETEDVSLAPLAALSVAEVKAAPLPKREAKEEAKGQAKVAVGPVAPAATGEVDKPKAETQRPQGAGAKKRGTYSKKIPREEMQAMGLEAARKLQKREEKITYGSVAKELGVPYYKVFYACRDDEKFVAMLDSGADK